VLFSSLSTIAHVRASFLVEQMPHTDTFDLGAENLERETAAITSGEAPSGGASGRHQMLFDVRQAKVTEK
jgi:hypothetical protein